MKGPFRFIREPSGRYVATAKVMPHITSTISICCVTGDWHLAVCDEVRIGMIRDGFTWTLKQAKEEAKKAGLTVTLTAEVYDA